MKINSINSFNYSPKAQSFGHTAVPYPEFESSYYKTTQPATVNKIIEKIYSLFTPEVDKKSQEIKDDINKIYDAGKKTPDFNGDPKKQLLSVLA